MKVFLFVLIFFVPILSYALTIDEAVILAIDSSYKIKQQQSILSARKLESSNAYLVFFPKVGIQATHNYSWEALTGGNNSSINPFDYDYSNQTVATAYINLNIFNGLYDYALIGLTKYASASQSYQAQSTLHDIIFNTRNSFIEVLKAKADLRIANENLKLLKAQRRQAEANYENGLMARRDVLQVDLYLSSAELEKITSEGMLNIKIQQLENAINRKIASEEELIDPILTAVDLYNFDTFKNMVFEKNSSLKALEMNLIVSGKQEMIKRQSLYPKIDATFQYSKYFADENNFGSSTPGIPSLSFNRDSGAIAGISASWDIIVATSAILNAQAQVKETMALSYAIADTKNNLILDIQTSIENFNTSSAALDQAKINVAFAEENYKTVDLLYNEAAATTTEVLDASVMLNQAKVDHASAIYSVIASVYKLERLIEDRLPSDDNDIR